MANTSIIFYGKPQSWESYEFSKSGEYKRCDIGTPALKPGVEDGTVLHYYVQGNYHYLELYEFAVAYDTARSGVVIGVCIKSDSALDISEKNISILSGLLVYYKNKALTKNLQFNTYDLLNIVKNFNDIKDYIKRIIPTIEPNDSPPKNYSEDVRLFFLKNYKKNINNIRQHIDAFSDVYVSQDSSIYKTAINENIWYDAGEKILTVDEDGKLVELVKKSSKPNSSSNNVIMNNGTGTGGSDYRKRQAERDAEKRDRGKRMLKRVIKYGGIAACLAVTFFFSKAFIMDAWKTHFGTSENTSETPSKDSFGVTKNREELESLVPRDEEDTLMIEQLTPTKAKIQIAKIFGKWYLLEPELLDSLSNKAEGGIANVQWGNPQYYTIDMIIIPKTNKQGTITATYNEQQLLTVKLKEIERCKTNLKKLQEIQNDLKTDTTEVRLKYAESICEQVKKSQCDTHGEMQLADEILAQIRKIRDH